METALVIIGFIVLCIIGIAWDYYKPARFRTGYRNVKIRGESGGSRNSGSSGWSGDSWGGDCGGGDGGGD